MKKTILITGLLLLTILLFGCASNKIKPIAPTKNGKLHGTFKDFDINTGKLTYKAEYINGKKNGQVYTYTREGRLWMQESYVNDVKNGLVKYWDWLNFKKRTTYLSRTETYVNGIKSGPFTRYKKDGSVANVTEYVNGQPKNIKAMQKKWDADTKALLNSSSGKITASERNARTKRACEYAKKHINTPAVLTDNTSYRRNKFQEAVMVCKYGWSKGNGYF